MFELKALLEQMGEVDEEELDELDDECDDKDSTDELRTLSNWLFSILCGNGFESLTVATRDFSFVDEASSLDQLSFGCCGS